MAAWIPITLFAAFVQNLRFMLQKHLKATRLSTGGATFARFIYSAPLVALIAAGYGMSTGQAWPAVPGRFWAFALAGGLAQIVATMCVVALFSRRNFAVGITFKKTEVLQTALMGFLVLGEAVSPAGLVAILIGFVAVLLLSDVRVPGGPAGLSRFFNPAAGLGLASGVLFAVSATGYRGASLALGPGDPFFRAALTLAVVTAAQSLAMLAWLKWREPGEIARVFVHWRIAGLVGLTSMLGSLGWFTAFTLQKAAYVKALGQVELIFSFLAATFWFRETTTGRELVAMGLLSLSILILILAL
ncbi:drug/metabolite transporter (DMT)-like permease [Rhodovulum iodosum]|uniref:Drug/metabolite transporter (DMT)-like permease n=1 Tax=Rhodovulum iodosum TaxID=68291 RepID=A0ABV3XPB2_9RHOB|nr:DMT family transporter [Rhodovulum robiginosum]RSK31538.1 DMT family transporter [Rhodovulum robiginosum]